ncbi:unnamed protein product [Protopolystoma xenopodis]|uniref:Uncharacterized protein n=1 Tax=Protopolystoma xenopodis TaxID=117903 RepID=A0A3S5FFW2_9PLAT|nr:unnamed protein product [Protopolystoma xenopodis]
MMMKAAGMKTMTKREKRTKRRKRRSMKMRREMKMKKGKTKKLIQGRLTLARIFTVAKNVTLRKMNLERQKILMKSYCPIFLTLFFRSVSSYTKRRNLWRRAKK